MKISRQGIELIKRFEGCALEAYQDAVGIWTIGYGHILGVKEHHAITQEEADLLLQDDLHRFERGVSALTAGLDLTQPQFDAVVAFAFNVGLTALAKSTLLSNLRAGDFEAAGNEFLRWNKAGGKVLPGLSRRREAERMMFLA